VPREIGEARLARLQRRIDEQYAAASAAMVGTIERALVTGRARRDSAELSARTERNRVVNFAGDADLIGRYADIRITAARAHSLRGELTTV
jgi:tRNA-2-methylthio-N6-dimethylallyladenosine synthase